MPTLDAHLSGPIKILAIGDSGTGKSGSIASLINENIIKRAFILDYDNGLDAVARFTNKDKMNRVIFETLTDEISLRRERAGTKGPPKAWLRGIQLLDKWDTYGGITSWLPDDLLVVDTLTSMGEAAMQHVLSINGRTGMLPHQSDWGGAMNLQEGLLAALKASAIKCNIIVFSHVTFVSDDVATGMAKGYPSALGSKLPPKVGRYFNTQIVYKSSGTGKSARREIHTVPTAGTETKVPLPKDAIAPSLPIETGLATLFKALQGEAN